jgi:hypothetical protein
MDEEQKPQRISNVMAALMIALAVVFDLLSLIPLVNILVDFIAWVTFGLWLLFLGVGFMNARRLATMLTSVTIEAIPFLSFLPGITVAIIGPRYAVSNIKNMALSAL